jgi:predicted RNA-binding protein with PUA-like domain
MRFWLFKSEPESFSFQDLMAAPQRTTGWDGVRNYQARNFLRDDIKRGDMVLFYHSNAAPPGIAGIAEVVKEAHPDLTALDAADHHFDPKSNPENPTWLQVAIKGIRAIDPLLGLPQLRATPGLSGMELLRKGSRLSIQPVSADEWAVIQQLIG